MIEEESSERMFRIILLSNQKKNKSVSCFSCLQTYYTRSDDHARLETISQPHKFLHGLLHYPACAVYGIFLRADRACDAAPEDAFSGTDFFKGNAVGIVPGHPVSWKTEDVL